MDSTKISLVPRLLGWLGRVIRLNSAMAYALVAGDATEVAYRASGGKQKLVVDSGASQHMITERSKFLRYWPMDGRVQQAGKSDSLKAIGQGDCLIEVEGSSGTTQVLLKGCWHVPDLDQNLLSIRAWNKRESGIRRHAVFGENCLLRSQTSPDVAFEADKASDVPLMSSPN